MTPDILTGWKEQHAALFGKHTIKMAHNLEDSGLFTETAIAKLIDDYPDDHYNINSMGSDHRRKQWREGVIAGQSGEDVIKAISKGRMWINLRRVMDVEPRYNKVLNQIFEEFEALVRPMIEEHFEIETSVSEPDLRHRCDQTQLETALMNLVLNARDAMPAGGQVTISTRIETRGRGEGYAVLSVEDTGTGIDPAVRERLFDPFVSGKGQARNSGLGLAMVQSFVRQAGGEVSVYSRPGMGSRFCLRFPAVAPKGAPIPQPEPTPAANPARPARILLVEDNDGVRTVFTRILRLAGHSVEAVRDGEEGVRAFSEIGPFELLLADMVVPGRVQGPDLAERLLRLHPSLRVLFVSGDARPDIAPRHPILQKPLSRRDLLDAVHRALAA